MSMSPFRVPPALLRELQGNGVRPHFGLREKDPMGLPEADSKAEISEAKMVRYLLSPTHRAGRSKAAIFRKHGFTEESWQALADALRRQAIAGTVTAVWFTNEGVLR